MTSRKKFDGVPTESMFGDSEVDEMRQTKEPTKKPRSVAAGRCPECSNMRLGVVRQGQHLVWRQHYYITWSGAQVVCRASGVATCVAPERVSEHYRNETVALLCPHTRKERRL